MRQILWALSRRAFDWARAFACFSSSILFKGGVEFLFLFCPAGLGGLLCGILPLLVLLEGFGAHGVTVTNKCGSSGGTGGGTEAGGLPDFT